MPQSFSTRITYNGKVVLAVILPQHRKDGMYYEVNVPNVPRFYMGWSPLGRYDLAPGNEINVPYELVLAVSDIIEETIKKQN
jgi:hypothetical protein